jgi:predicted amidohydrolase YtcJ
MKSKRSMIKGGNGNSSVWLAIVIVMSLGGCGQPSSTIPVASNPITPLVTNVQIEPVPSLAVVDVALGKWGFASQSVTGQPPGNVLDGDPNTMWRAGAGPEQWIQIDLGAATTITEIRLVTYQLEAGQTRHRILVGVSENELTLVHEFAGTTTDRQELVYSSVVPLPNIRYVRVVTTDSPGWVAWRDIHVQGIFVQVSATPTTLPVADTIYFNGTIITMEAGNPTGEAIAIREGKILAVGSLEAVESYQGGSTVLVDLGGMTMTPGFIDSHQHRIGDRWHYGSPPVNQVFYEILKEGWTSIHEMWVDGARLNELVSLDSQGQLPVRVSMYLKMNSEYAIDNWWQAYQPLQQYSPSLQIAGLKITLDREWGQNIFLDQANLEAIVQDAHNRGWQVATHSFSPTANALILDAYGKALNGSVNEPFRFRIEHIGVMTDTEIQKMGTLGILGSVQLVGASSWPDDASFKTYIPPEQTEMAARWRDLINANIFLIGNTDAPWCCTDWRHNFQGAAHPPTVIDTIYQGVTRTTFTGRQPEAWQAAQVVTVEEALAMMTINGAYAAHQEDVIGSLKAGKYADLVVLSANPLSTPVQQLPDLQVVMTVVGGNVEYCASGFQTTCSATSSP